MGRAVILLFPRSPLPLSHYGISPRWRLDDHAYEIRHLLGGRYPILYGRMYSGHRSCTQSRIYTPVRFSGTVLIGEADYYAVT